jgi:hypothetical protein
VGLVLSAIRLENPCGSVQKEISVLRRGVVKDTEQLGLQVAGHAVSRIAASPWSLMVPHAHCVRISGGAFHERQPALLFYSS